MSSFDLDFRRLGTLGKGRFSDVGCYKCLLNGKGRLKGDLVAIKSYGIDELALRSCQINQEAETLSALASSKSRMKRYICDMVDQIIVDGNFHLILMPKLGGPLHKHMTHGRKGRLPATVTRGYAAEIVCALRFIHSQWCIHRDLKASNILLDEFGHISLSDFGSAKLLLPDDEMKASSKVMFDAIGNMIPTIRERGPMAQHYDELPRSRTLTGTPDYISPEMFALEDTFGSEEVVCGYSFAVDWWAFGVLLFHMLTGQPPPWQSRATRDHAALNHSDGQVWDWSFPIQTYRMMPLTVAADACTDEDQEDTYVTNLGLDLVSIMMNMDPAERWRSAKSVTEHPFFASVDWRGVEMGKNIAPNPDFERRLGFLDFRELVDENGRTHTDNIDRATDELTPEQQALFAGY